MAWAVQSEIVTKLELEVDLTRQLFLPGQHLQPAKDHKKDKSSPGLILSFLGDLRPEVVLAESHRSQRTFSRALTVCATTPTDHTLVKIRSSLFGLCFQMLQSSKHSSWVPSAPFLKPSAHNPNDCSAKYRDILLCSIDVT